MKIKPLSDNVLLRILPEQKTESGIELLGNSNSNLLKAKVLAVGPGEEHPQTRLRMPMNVQETQTVLIPKGAGSIVDKSPDGDTILVSQRVILALVF